MITEIDSVTVYDLKAYLRFKQQKNLQPQSIVTMFNLIKAFFIWCKRKSINWKYWANVATPKVPKKIPKGFTTKEVKDMINRLKGKTTTVQAPKRSENWGCLSSIYGPKTKKAALMALQTELYKQFNQNTSKLLHNFSFNYALELLRDN